MKIKFGIITKLSLSFATIILLIIILGAVTLVNLRRNEILNNKISGIYSPSVKLLNTYYSELIDSKMLIKNWVHIEKQEETIDKTRLRELHSVRLPGLNDRLATISGQWNNQQAQFKLDSILVYVIDSLVPMHESIMASLASFESYDDIETLFFVHPMVEQDGDIMILTDELLFMVSDLIKNQEQLESSARSEMMKSSGRLRRYFILITLTVILTAAVISLMMSNSLKVSLTKISQVINSLSRGDLTTNVKSTGSDEFSVLINELNGTISKLRTILISISDVNQ